MDGADILGIVALAISGGAGAYVAWYLSRFGIAGIGGRRTGGGGPDRSAATPSGMPAGGRGSMMMTHDPQLVAEIAALREQVAGIAATQARMLQEQAEREGMMLAEMRAVASVMDPKIVESLARIEDTVGVPRVPPPDPGPYDGPDATGGAHLEHGPAPPRTNDLLYAVPDPPDRTDARGPEGAKTIRRG